MSMGFPKRSVLISTPITPLLLCVMTLGWSISTLANIRHPFGVFFKTKGHALAVIFMDWVVDKLLSSMVIADGCDNGVMTTEGVAKLASSLKSPF